MTEPGPESLSSDFKAVLDEAETSYWKARVMVANLFCGEKEDVKGLIFLA